MTEFTQIGLKQINLEYEVPLDRLATAGLGRLNVYDEDDNLIASIPATDESIKFKENT
jgi:hypothetical protein